MSMNEAIDPSMLTTVLCPNSSLASKSKQELIDAYIMIRSLEEISMLEMEMKNTIQYYVDRKRTLQLIESLSQREDAFAKGAVALL